MPSSAAPQGDCSPPPPQGAEHMSTLEQPVAEPEVHSTHPDSVLAPTSPPEAPARGVNGREKYAHLDYNSTMLLELSDCITSF